LRLILSILISLFAVVAAVLAIRSTAATLYQSLPRPDTALREDGTVQIVVRPGDGADQIAERLEESGLIDDAEHFRILTRVMGVQSQLQAGEYAFEKHLSMPDIVARLHLGVTSSLVVTIPEGLRAEEIAIILERNGVTTRDEFLQALKEDYEIRALKGQRPASLEGYLFPATYGFSPNMRGREVVQRFLDNFDKRVAPVLSENTSGLSVQEALVLASIVEREAVVPDERPQIAGVYLNRIRRQMLLQADPTVQYALAANPTSLQRFGFWKKELTEADLKYDSPFNTYVYRGLPPAPIANPGIASITAALRPAQSNYLFFVAREDGSHAFAETLDQHNLNVSQHQR
jgi:UPF0755 protein